MSIYRSQTVDRFKLYLPRQSAWEIMSKLGQTQLIHVIPSKSNDIIRHFTIQIKRIQQSIQKLSSLEDVLLQKKMIQLIRNIEKEKVQQIFKIFGLIQTSQNNRNQINQIVENVDQLWEYYVQINKRTQMLQKQVSYCRQNIAVLLTGEKQYGRAFFENQRQRSKSYDKIIVSSLNKINFKAGVIRIQDELRFKRTVFRITKGNSLIMTKKFSDIFQSLLKNQSEKVVFFVIYPANDQSYFDKKLVKLIANFCDKSFDYPSEYNNSFQQNLLEFKKTFQEAKNLQKMCENQLQTFLFQRLLEKLKVKTQSYFSIKKYQYLKYYLMREKQIYENLNQMEIFNHFFQGQIFIRQQHVKNVQTILNCGGNELPPGNIVPVSSQHKFPSSFALNDFTLPAQQIVQTYGVPRYKEINPSLYTTMTFPFLFGVMFGDIAHGIILLTFGVILIFQKKRIIRLENQILKMLLPYRYLITLMGFFSTYCGFIYNDFLSISLNLFGSCYSLQNINQGQQINRISNQCVYSIGIDPVWSVAQNSLNFTNSLKMKISVIIAVIHMTFGVILRALNDIYFKNYKQLLFVFIPQLVFMISLFGYMDFLIIFKWLTNWGTTSNTALAPSIITQMISIPLSLGSTQGKPLWNKASQQNLQLILLLLAGISIPLMLLPVPLMKIFKIEKRRIKPKKTHKKFHKWNESDMQKQINEMLINRQQSNYYNQLDEKLHLNSSSHEEESSSQIFVHQIIQTIQYVLGCVSNTASYLRLWALSLAHSQLSQVFFEKTVQGSLQSGYSGIFMNLIGFFFLACVTVGIMLLMDTMECFLHTLRLHWVEFQNKFYKGDGIGFKNFSFNDKINEQLRKKGG